MRDWLIHISCHDKPMGPPIQTSGWEILSKLTLVRAILPPGWEAEAHPVIEPSVYWE